LERQIRRRDDERPANQTAGLEFLEEEPGHDGLASAGVIGKEESDAGKLQKVVVNRLQLVGQRVHASDGK
jgi:hypothetical protein